MSRQSTNPREPLEELKKYPAFQMLRSKAEQHELEFRPKEAAALKASGNLDEVLDSRTEAAWNSLVDQRANGANPHEAEEVAFENILLPSEQQEEQAQQERAEQMDES
jgi:hypothetical protein